MDEEALNMILVQVELKKSDRNSSNRHIFPKLLLITFQLNV